jgi:uncharacterized protein YgiM (DUF1202 family)
MLFFYFLILAQLMPAMAAQKMYVQGESLQARKEPSPSSAVVIVISKGQAVDTLEGKGIWIKIRHNSNEAWVPLISLSKNKVDSPDSLLKSNSMIEKNSRKRSNAVATAGAARGLLANESKILTKIPKTNYRALQKMAHFRVPPEETKDFVK